MIGCVISLIVSIMPFLVIDLSVIWKIVLIAIDVVLCTVFKNNGCIVAIITLALWIWGLVCALHDPFSPLSIIYYIFFAVFILYSLFTNTKR